MHVLPYCHTPIPLHATSYLAYVRFTFLILVYPYVPYLLSYHFPICVQSLPTILYFSYVLTIYACYVHVYFLIPRPYTRTYCLTRIRYCTIFLSTYACLLSILYFLVRTYCPIGILLCFLYLLSSLRTYMSYLLYPGPYPVLHTYVLSCYYPYLQATSNPLLFLRTYYLRFLSVLLSLLVIISYALALLPVSYFLYA
jgi:hypothetical protein